MNESSPTAAPGAGVLLAEHDPQTARPVVAFLTDLGYRVEWADSGEKAHNLLDAQTFDVVIADHRVGRHHGLRILQVARERKPDVCTIVITEPEGVARATLALKEGVYDFQTKPLNLEKLEAVIARGIQFQQVLYEQQLLKRRLDEHYGLASLIGESRPMALIYNTLRQCASLPVPVVLAGEPGTGRDLVAQAIHNGSVRRDAPFVKLDCRAGSGAALEHDFFGAPATTNSDAHRGRLELADGGTLYLDSISDLPAEWSATVMEIAKTGRCQRPSDGKPLQADVRLLVSITLSRKTDSPGHPLAQGLADEADAILVDLPPLRERRSDIPLLLEYFLAEAGRRHRKAAISVDWMALDALQRYAWPGNVRELRECAEAIAFVAKPGRTAGLAQIPSTIRDGAEPADATFTLPVGATLSEIERIAIEQTMRAVNNDKQACARQLGIGLRTLYRKLNEYAEQG